MYTKDSCASFSVAADVYLAYSVNELEAAAFCLCSCRCTYIYMNLALAVYCFWQLVCPWSSSCLSLWQPWCMSLKQQLSLSLWQLMSVPEPAAVFHSDSWCLSLKQQLSFSVTANVCPWSSSCLSLWQLMSVPEAAAVPAGGNWMDGRRRFSASDQNSKYGGKNVTQ